MPLTPTTDWRKDFGISDWTPPAFFANKDDINAAGQAAPQAHALCRAFDSMKLDGIICFDKVPVIYFKEVPQIDPAEVLTLHRQFWNHGLAPILVLVAPEQVHVYSSLTGPVNAPTDLTQPDGLVTRLNRVAAQLQEFVIAVESGEFFRAHSRSFDPKLRVDRDLLRNLQAAREALVDASSRRLDPQVLDALLCRLVFTCYLFDRKVIGQAYLESLGIPTSEHLRDILGCQPKSEAKARLYCLFTKLGEDFNGDLFSDDLDQESNLVTTKHLDILDRFFRAQDVRTGQQSFWPYDFGIIPIETISAIYEHFLKAADAKGKKEAGAFYTPRSLAELVLDTALEGVTSLLDKRFLDPSCGSGIFLVGLFNRLAEEWKRLHPKATHLQQVTGLLTILRENIFGVDKSETACRITAFSLYLAFLDQFFPRDIQELQRRRKVLPRLVHSAGQDDAEGGPRTICCADFFTAEAVVPEGINLVVGNPPWASVKDRDATVARWCAERDLPFPDRQIATGYVWKAVGHLEQTGRVCFVLPHGTLFNHGPTWLSFQRAWMSKHAAELVLNLVDYQRFLFEEAAAPAVVVRYRKEPPADNRHRIDYWAPKTDWGVTQAEVITILPQDRSRVTVREVLDDLKGPDAPLIWKERFWATFRDWRLLDRLALLARLRDMVGQPTQRDGKRWLIAEGFQPLGENAPPSSARTLTLPSDRFIKATSRRLSLFLLLGDCETLPSQEIVVRRLIRNTDIFRAPHVLVTKGLSRSAFADFDVVFRHAIRGIHGPKEDRDSLIFLAAYLQSALARYYLFHTSSNWGVSRAEVHVEELLRLPFPMPDQTTSPDRCKEIVREVAKIVTQAGRKAGADFADREGLMREARINTESLVEEYFDIDPFEKMLIEDTNRVIIPSVRPTRQRLNVPTIKPSTPEQQELYTRLLCDTLNGWARDGECQVHGRARASQSAGVGMVVLEKTRRGESPTQLDGPAADVLASINRLQRTTVKSHGTFELVRGLKVFHKNLLYVIKPIGQRFWTRTAALNDADELAATINMRPAREGA